MVLLKKGKMNRFIVLTLLIVSGFSMLRAQDVFILLPSRELSVGSALQEAEKQGGYSIVVSSGSLDLERTVLFSSSRLSVEKVLNETLTGTGYKWEIIGKQISIVSDGAGEDHVPYSTIHRSRPSSTEMRVVRDPLSKNQTTPDEISLIRNGYWRSAEGGKDSLSLVTLNFRVNSSSLERDYLDNAYVLDLINRTFSDKRMLQEMDFITITATASPEGNTVVNEKLASERALAVKTYIMWKYPFMDRDKIFTFSIGEDWIGLRKMVEEDQNAPYRKEILHIIDTNQDSSKCWTMLKNLGGGTAYRYLSSNMLPYLRGAAACMIYYKEDAKSGIVMTDTVYIDRDREKIVEVRVVDESAPRNSPYYFAIKTNLLYDLALLPNLALEFSLGGRWSIEVEGQWAWWNTPTTHKNCWRIQSAGLEARKWLGDKSKTPLTGHYLGLYGMVGTYDVRFNNKTGYLSNMSYSAGVSYGYALPLSRRWNLEFGIAAGYLGGKYKTYGVYDETYKIFCKKEEKKMQYFGPTKAKISLVWLIGSGKNETKRK